MTDATISSKSAWDKLGVKTCDKCNLKTSDMGLFQAHSCRNTTACISYSVPKGLFCCSLCQAELAEGPFEEHLEQHLTLKPYACYYCNEQFRTREDVCVHVKKHISNGAAWQIGFETCILRVSKRTREYMMKAKNRGKCFFIPKNSSFIPTPFGIATQSSDHSHNSRTSVFLKITQKPLDIRPQNDGYHNWGRSLETGTSSSVSRIPPLTAYQYINTTNSWHTSSHHHINANCNRVSNTSSQLQTIGPFSNEPSSTYNHSDVHSSVFPDVREPLCSPSLSKIKSKVACETNGEENTSPKKLTQGVFQPFTEESSFFLLMRGTFYCLHCKQKWHETIDFIKHIWLYHLCEDNSLPTRTAKFSLHSEVLQSILKTLHERTIDIELSKKLSQFISNTGGEEPKDLICNTEYSPQSCHQANCDEKLPLIDSLQQHSKSNHTDVRTCLTDVNINIDNLTNPRTHNSSTRTCNEESANGDNHKVKSFDIKEKSTVDCKTFYQCGFFDCVFSSHLPVDLLIHNENAHPMKTDIPCVYCGKMNKTASGLLEHLDSHVGQNGLKAMHTCSLMHSSKASFIVENRNIKKIFNILRKAADRKKEVGSDQDNCLQYRCNLCCSDFPTLEDLRIHLNRSLLKVVACKYCRGHFLDSESWHRHMLKDHPNEVKQYRINEKLLCKDRKLNSSTYEKLFTQRKEFRSTLHKQQTLVSSSLKASGVEESQNTFIKNEEHTNSEKIVFEKSAETNARESFVTPELQNELNCRMKVENLNSHLSAPESQEEDFSLPGELSVPIYFKCSMCPSEKFSSYFTAKRHKEIHSGTKASIRRFSSLNFDISKKYKCTYCSYTCAGDKNVMLKHIRSSHKYFVCGYCGDDYTVIRYLKNHQKFQHRGQEIKFEERYPRLRTAFRLHVENNCDIKSEVKEDNDHSTSQNACSRKRHHEAEEKDQPGCKQKFFDPAGTLYSAVDNASACGILKGPHLAKQIEFTQVEREEQQDKEDPLNIGPREHVKIPPETEMKQVSVKETKIRCLSSVSFKKPKEILIALELLPMYEKYASHTVSDNGTANTSPEISSKSKAWTSKPTKVNEQEGKATQPHAHLIPATCSDTDSTRMSNEFEKSANVKKTQDTSNGMSISDFPFQCYTCKVCMKSIEYVLDHIRWLHSSDQNGALVFDRRSQVAFTKDGLVKERQLTLEFQEQNHLCTACSFRGFSRNDVVAHVKLAHPSKDSERCVISMRSTSDDKSELVLLPGFCDNPLPTSARSLPVNQHQQTQEATSTNGLFSKDSLISKQASSNSNSLRYSCHLCPEVLRNEFYFKLHLARHEGFTCTSVLSSIPGLLLCSVCGYIAKSNNDLAHHTGKHLTQRRYACSHCDADDHKKTSIQKHITKCHNGIEDVYVIDREARSSEGVRPKIVDIDPSLKVEDIFKIPSRHLNKRLRQAGVKNLLVDSLSEEVGETFFSSSYSQFFNVKYI
ncbi:RE1-silencing transcription factor [Elysia marginata]|uniref:RE1-silencing transcription factor n=1 Tax=Elysia marginata TaxID=1093978 RepID=A0AAV4H4I8_9GAST|nr:RE1-silencing transcription factor [Elysia marginata]